MMIGQIPEASAVQVLSVSRQWGFMAFMGRRLAILVMPVTLVATLLVACQGASPTAAPESSVRTVSQPSASVAPSPAVIATTNSRSVAPATPGAARDIANNCFTCHGPDGRSPSTIPSLNGLSAEQIAAKLKRFKAGTEASTIMGRHTRAYSDAEIEAVAIYIGSSNR